MEAVAVTEAVVAPVAAVVMEMAVARVVAEEEAVVVTAAAVPVVVAETHDFNELKP